eukprot:CAMPEP_0117773528 /NCGR_PEP_ID=MMETSP0947-20121206/25901_1 /TAXON_ID=44440 /ORGANISM="Chattonella subsalsa, Strain CCMP2191" /LENGTH=149 /DNA_ID=CAMNT_0005599671 /DNA_START=31 /DNA_END=477 /DNA_ORIENTATION=+
MTGWNQYYKTTPLLRTCGIGELTELRLFYTFDLPSYQYARKNDWPIVTGSDMHRPGPAYAWTLLNLNTEELTAENVLRTIKSGKTSFVLDPTGTPMPFTSSRPLSSSYQKWYPWVAWAETLESMVVYEDQGQYSFQGSFCHETILEWHW